MSLQLANTSANQNAGIVSFSLKDNFGNPIITSNVHFFVLNALLKMN